MSHHEGRELWMWFKIELCLLVNFPLIWLKLIELNLSESKREIIPIWNFQKSKRKMLRRSPLVDFKSESIVQSVPDANANFDWEPSVGKTQKRNLKLDQLAYFMRQRQFEHVKALLGKSHFDAYVYLGIRDVPWDSSKRHRRSQLGI